MPEDSVKVRGTSSVASVRAFYYFILEAISGLMSLHSENSNYNSLTKP